MTTIRARISAAVASGAILFLGWEAASGHGATAGNTPVVTSVVPASETSTATTASTAATSGATGTFTGDTISNRFGSVTVTVALVDGRITEVTAQAQSNDNHSARINDQAIPMLREQVVAANSAAVSTISGATYTSQAYLTSLQSALDKS